MIKHELSDLFRQNSIHKKFVINYDGGTITNSDMLLEEFSLEESICSEEELRFGSCEASVIKFPISNVFTSLNGKVLDVSVVLDHNEDKPLKIGKYKVESDVPTADRKRKDITAYDALYDVINTDVAEWYNALLPNNDSTVTLKQFRDSFFGYFGIEQVEVSLINDAMIVTKTIQPTELSGSMVANAICELNGCFGHINRDGLMDYVFLKGFTEALYPSDDLYPAEDLFPEESNYHKYTKSDYSTGGCDYQEYVVRKITGLEIRQAEDSLGAFVGEKENPYVVSDNFLTYGKSTEEMTTIAQNMFNVINGIEYRPFTLNTFRGNPCVEVGDGIRIYTDNQIIQSYVLNRTLTGIQALSDAFETNGKEYRTSQVNSVQSQITQLKGKTNRLERTTEETLSQISDLEKNVESEFRQTAEEISSRVSKGEVISEINQSAEAVKIQANKISLEGLVTANEFFKINQDGSIEAVNGKFEGIVNASSLIAYNGIYLYQTSIGIPTPELIMNIESDIYSSRRLVLISPARIGDIHISSFSGVDHSISAPFLDISSDTGGVRMASSTVPTLRPKKDNDVTLGTSDYRYKTVYAKTSAIDTSDEKEKECVEDISEKYEELYFKVKPKTFRFRNNENTNHDRIHMGAISQQVEKAMEEVGLSDLELSFFCKDVATEEIVDEDGKTVSKKVLDENGEETYHYGLRYGEWIMLNTHMVQKLYEKVDKQQSEIESLKETVSFLMERLGGMANE